MATLATAAVIPSGMVVKYNKEHSSVSNLITIHMYNIIVWQILDTGLALFYRTFLLITDIGSVMC